MAAASRTRPLQGRLALLFSIPAPPFPNPAAKTPSLGPGILTLAPPIPHLARSFINIAIPKTTIGPGIFTLGARIFTLGIPFSDPLQLSPNITTR